MSDILADHARRFQALRELAAYIRANAQLPLDPETVADIIEHQATFDPPAAQFEPPIDVDDTRDVVIQSQDLFDGTP